MIQETWLPSHCLAMDSHSDSDILAFRQHATMYTAIILHTYCERLGHFQEMNTGNNRESGVFSVPCQVAPRSLLRCAAVNISAAVNQHATLGQAVFSVCLCLLLADVRFSAI
jgi:hypothetical protein